MNKKYIKISLLIGVFFVFLCGIMTYKSKSIRMGFLGTSYKNTMKASFKQFNGEETKKIKFNEGEIINFEYEIEQESGNLELQIRNEEGEILESRTGSNKGNIELKIDKMQKYKIVILAEKAKGAYRIEWAKK